MADKAVLIAGALGVTVEYLITGKKAKKEPASLVPPPQHKEVMDIVSKLNKYNYEVIASLAKTLLSLQTKNKSPDKAQH